VSPPYLPAFACITRPSRGVAPHGGRREEASNLIEATDVRNAELAREETLLIPIPPANWQSSLEQGFVREQAVGNQSKG